MPQRAVSVGTTRTRLASANSARDILIIENTDDTIDVYVGDVNVTASGDQQGLTLLPKQKLTISRELHGKLVEQAWYGITASGTAIVIVYELL